VRQELRKRIQDKLAFLYGPDQAESLVRSVEALVSASGLERRPTAPPLTEKSALLITYGDQVQDGPAPPLRTLDAFLSRHAKGLVERVHLLPFFPYSSDDGFSVIDFKAVNPAIGSWEHIRDLGKGFSLAFDAVINHVSSKSAWFQACLAGDPEREAFFIIPKEDEDLSRVVRPRDLPLLSEHPAAGGPKKFWTTFSADQVDLDFRNPRVLLAVLEILLFYISRGADILRLDAIAYLWKEAGTSCIHLPQTHAVVRLIRAVLDAAAPDVLLLTETNVPHPENISYFGAREEEAQMVYQFSLPPLLAHAILTGDAAYLTAWAQSLEDPGAGRSYLNFTASHDGVGVRPAEGILPAAEIDLLVGTAQKHGGQVSWRRKGGAQTPYELNIAYPDLLSGPNVPDEEAARRFLLSQALALAMPGVPGIYFHSLFGSRGDPQGAQRTGRARSINREKLELSRLEAELAKTGSYRRMVHQGYRELLRRRREEPAFHPSARARFQELHPAVFAVERAPLGGGPRLLALHNLSGKTVTAGLGRTRLQGLDDELELRAFEFRWLTEKL